MPRPPYTVPEQSVDARESARNRITRANQFHELLIAQYRSAYESYWQTPRTHEDRALTMAQMQSVIDQAQSTMIDVLTRSAKFVAFVADAYPESLLSSGTEGQEGFVEADFPARYHSAPYNYEITARGTINLLSLKPEWEAAS